MSVSSRAHYLRAFRKRSGLSQEEVGFLLGVKNGAKISRYEQGHRIPPLHTAIAYAAIFNVPVQQLFPDLQSETQKEIAKRLWELRSRLEKTVSAVRKPSVAERKLQWLNEHHPVKT